MPDDGYYDADLGGGEDTPIPIDDNYAKELEAAIVMQATGARGQAEPNSNEELSNILHQNNFGETGGITYGRVVYTSAYTNWYKCLLDDLGGERPCCGLTETSTVPFGVRNTSPYPPGVGVLIWLPPSGTYGYILGAVPAKVEDGALVHPDWISQGSNTGFKREKYYHQVLDLTEDDGGMTDFNNNSPVDGLGGGEWGRLNDLGGGLHIDSFMSFLRADETAGLWLFYLDRLARLCGHNFDLRTAMAEMMTRDDSGEGLHFSGFSPYAWEGMGAYAFGTTVHREESADDVQYEKPYATYEPVQDNQQAFYRLEEYRGYLGNPFMRQLMAPPAGAEGVNTYDNEQARVGLFREQLSMDGAYNVASAHSVAITKRSLIPIPKRVKLPEEPSGDVFAETNGEYRFAGQNGTGPDHNIKSMQANDALPHLQEATALSDFVAHAFEWKGLHPFHYHVKDFNTPEQADLSPLTQLQEPLNFSKLSTEQWLPVANSQAVKIDHRYDETDYFENTSGIYLLPRGGVVIRGGGGEEIRMVGGSIQMSAPGDLWMQPGRNVNILAADDCIIKAFRSVDITATENDIRCKAEGNFQVLAGNETVGGVFIESRTPAVEYNFDKAGEEAVHGGIILKSPHGQIVNWAKDVYLRTGGGDVDSGQIMIDGDKGEADIRTVSRSFVNHMTELKADTFPVTGGKTVANNYTAVNTQIHTPLQCDGGLVVTRNGIVVGGNIACVGGHIGTEYAHRFGFLVGWLIYDSLSKSQAIIDDTLLKMATVKVSMATDYTTNIEQQWYDNNKAGHDDIIESGRFTLRTEQQMHTQAWELPETFWAQTATLTNQSFGVWAENDVKGGPDGDQKPYPGKDKWEGNNYKQIELNLHDPITGRDKPRGGGLYENPALAKFTPASPENTYPIIVN